LPVNLTIFAVSRLEPFAYQAQYPFITYPFSDEFK